MSPVTAPTGLPLLMAFDLDGTLIAERTNELPDGTAPALARLRAAGVKLAIITGRDQAPAAVVQAMRPHAIASNNGGRIEIDGELRSETTFTDADLEATLGHELDGARVVLFTADALYVDIPPGYAPEPWMAARGYRPLAQAPRTGIQKVGYFHPQVAGFAQRLRDSHPHLVLTGAQEPYPHFLTVTPVGAHKGAALLLIADALNIPQERTVAFGDSDNDEAMLEIAGFAVQVGTLPLLQRHAHAHVPSHAALGSFLGAWADTLPAD